MVTQISNLTLVQHANLCTCHQCQQIYVIYPATCLRGQDQDLTSEWERDWELSSRLLVFRAQMTPNRVVASDKRPKAATCRDYRLIQSGPKSISRLDDDRYRHHV